MRALREVLLAMWETLKELGWGNLYVFGLLPLPIIMAASVASKHPIGYVATGISAASMLFSAVAVGRAIEFKVTERRLAPLAERLKGMAEEMREMSVTPFDGLIEGVSSRPSLEYQYLQLIDDVSAIYAPRFTAMEAEITKVRRTVEDMSLARPSNKGMTEKRRRRAHIFKQIKDANPQLSYAQVAARANLDFENELGKVAEEHDVRNDYEAMGWAWEPATRLR